MEWTSYVHCPFSVTAGLWRHAEVGVEVGVADDLVVAHPLARGVDDVDEERVALMDGGHATYDVASTFYDPSLFGCKFTQPLCWVLYADVICESSRVQSLAGRRRVEERPARVQPRYPAVSHESHVMKL